MKEQRIFIEIIEFDNGSKCFSVGGGTKDNGQMESFDTLEKCIEEIKTRVAQTILEM